MNPHDVSWQECNEFRPGHPADVVSSAVDEACGLLALFGGFAFFIVAEWLLA